MAETDVRTIAVIGVGTMGHGIAEVAALAGYDVNLLDISEKRVRDGYENIEWSVNKLIDKDQLDEDKGTAALDRIETFVNLPNSVDGVEVVLEAVPEDLDVKREVFAELDQHAPDNAVFASNTSTFPITKLGAATDRPEQVCGMHFFIPPMRMPLVEVIAGEKTGEATLEFAEDLTRTFDKTPIRVRKDVPGFVVNRVLVPMLNEATWLVESDVATITEVDSTSKFGLGLPMGCFELTDQIGIDVALDVVEYMHESLGEAYQPSPLLVETAEDGTYGKKTGEGFYDYDNGGVDIPSDQQRDVVEKRLLGVAINEVAKLVEADVADPAEIDEAMTLGAGFPKGPTEMAAEIGFDCLYNALTDLCSKTDMARYEPAPLFETWVEQSGPNGTADAASSYESISVTRSGDGVAEIKLDRPDAMNTVNEAMLDDLAAAIDALEADDTVTALLLTGAGDQAFCSGADLQEMSGGLEPFEAVEFSRKGQETFGQLTEVSMPVIAGVDGFCLGGGMELATCADLCMASERAEFGQPEHDLGILPGWGGTQRLSRIVGERRAREIIFTADRYDAETMYDYGFVNEVVTDGELHERATDLAADLAKGPPLAQKTTKRAMIAGRTDIEAGLAAESDAFGILWTTADTSEGIDAFVNRRDPEFEGK